MHEAPKPPVSTDLVPTTYDRAAWNTLHNTNLREHGPNLTAEQAEQINSQCNVIVYTGEHGKRKTSLEQPDHHATPTREQYEQMDQIVDGMIPGWDILVIEGHSFRAQRPELSSFGVRNPMAKQRQEAAVRQLELIKEKGALDLWGYASMRAELKGVKVVLADYDAFEMESAHKLNELSSTTRKGKEFMTGVTEGRREQKAFNTVKDVALQDLDPYWEPGDLKRSVVMLYGELHRHQLKRQFNNAKIDASFENVVSSDDEFEQRRKMWNAVGELILQAEGILASR